MRHHRLHKIAVNNFLISIEIVLAGIFGQDRSEPTTLLTATEAG